MTADTAAASTLWPPHTRRFVLLVLCLVAALNLIDRQLISILMEPIRKEFAVSDTMMGLLTGLSFAAVYVTAALPMARWSDQKPRRTIIAYCVLVWGAMTMLCGLAQSYVQLAAARMGVALGEAGYNPSAHSMIADLYPLPRRAAAIGVFNAAASLGIGFGLFFGGWLSGHFSWRIVFFIAGAPCLLVAMIIRFVVTEPPRGMADDMAPARQAPPLRESLRWLAGLRTYRWLAVSAMTCAFVNYGLQIWAPSFFVRLFELSTKEVGFKLGLASAIGLFIGTIVSGMVADRLGRRDVRWYMRVAGAGMLLTVPCGFLAFLSSNANLGFAYYCITVGFVSSWPTPIHAMTQTIAPPRMRGMASAIIGFCLNLFGYGLGPLFVGVINDHLQPSFGQKSIRYSLLILLLGCAVAALAAFATNGTIREDLELEYSAT